MNSRIQALVAHPTQAQTVFAGGDTGMFVSHDGGARWERIATQQDLPTIWSLAIDPTDPNIVFAGTRPAGIYRSLDGGQRWEKLSVDIAQECAIGAPFVTALVVDPDDHRTVWAGVEIDGVFRSTDGGDTWTHLENGLYDLDVHDMTIAATRPKRLFVSTARDMFLSDDLGDTWHPWEPRTNGRSPMRVAWRSSPTIPACCTPDAGRPRRAKKDTCCAPRITGSAGRSCPYPLQRMRQYGALPRILPTPTASWRSAFSGRCT